MPLLPSPPSDLRADVALDQVGMLVELVVVHRLDLERLELAAEALEVDVAVAGQADGERLLAPSGWTRTTRTFFSVSAAVQGRSSRGKAWLRWSTRVAMVGVSGVGLGVRRGRVVVRLGSSGARTSTASTFAA